MTADQIDKLFQDTIQIKGIEKDAGVSKQVIYNYRNRSTLSLGDKIDFLMKLDLIEVHKKTQVEVFGSPEILSLGQIPEHFFNQETKIKIIEEMIKINSSSPSIEIKNIENVGTHQTEVGYKHIFNIKYGPNEPTPKS